MCRSCASASARGCDRGEGGATNRGEKGKRKRKTIIVNITSPRNFHHDLHIISTQQRRIHRHVHPDRVPVRARIRTGHVDDGVAVCEGDAWGDGVSVAKGAGGEAGDGGRDVPAMFQKISMNPNFSWNMSHYDASQRRNIRRRERYIQSAESCVRLLRRR